jgi:hypothetical protein
MKESSMATKANRTPAVKKPATSKATVPAAPDKTKTLQIVAGTDKTRDRLVAEVAAAGMAGNASTLIAFSASTFGEISLTECALVLKDAANAVNGGDLSGAESMLTAQAAALNAIFGELARRSAMNMGEHLGATECYMRLALKAQGQCRATLETLAAIKNPPVVFARQANINNGGQQQVNNGAAPDHANNSAQVRAGTHAAKETIEQTGLLEASDGERMDARATGATSGADPHMATLASIDRPAHR